jgi:hypothetical protein
VDVALVVDGAHPQRERGARLVGVMREERRSTLRARPFDDLREQLRADAVAPRFGAHEHLGVVERRRHGHQHRGAEVAGEPPAAVAVRPDAVIGERELRRTEGPLVRARFFDPVDREQILVRGAPGIDLPDDHALIVAAAVARAAAGARA